MFALQSSTFRDSAIVSSKHPSTSHSARYLRRSSAPAHSAHTLAPRLGPVEPRNFCTTQKTNRTCQYTGIMAMPDESTGDGYPIEMQTNHLSQFMLASKLLPTLKKGASRSGAARIVTHSSVSRKSPNTPVNKEHYGKNGGNLGGDGTNARWQRYHQTKLANVCFMQALKVRNLSQNLPSNLLSNLLEDPHA